MENGITEVLEALNAQLSQRPVSALVGIKLKLKAVLSLEFDKGVIPREYFVRALYDNAVDYIRQSCEESLFDGVTLLDISNNPPSACPYCGASPVAPGISIEVPMTDEKGNTNVAALTRYTCPNETCDRSFYA